MRCRGLGSGGMTDVFANETALGLVFLLGLRHGLDPDHIAVVDNLTFRAADERPALAPWTGALFALGHSLSVAAVAGAVSALSGLLALPSWVGEAFDVAVVGLLLLVGLLNLRALLGAGAYRPVGWRQGLVPRRLRDSSHPLAVLAIGMIFGLVFDTTTQAAAWGAAASAGGGVAGALAVAGAFAAGMVITDTADSWIVARLLRVQGDAAAVQGYRRSVGWLIVLLSFGMAGYALAGLIEPAAALADPWPTWLGVGLALTVVIALMRGRRVGGVL